MGKNFFPYLWLSNKAVRIGGIVGKGEAPLSQERERVAGSTPAISTKKLIS